MSGRLSSLALAWLRLRSVNGDGACNSAGGAESQYEHS